MEYKGIEKAVWKDIEELQVPDLEQCGVVERTEELLSQEECPHLQQELRTILLEERGFDV